VDYNTSAIQNEGRSHRGLLGKIYVASFDKLPVQTDASTTSTDGAGFGGGKLASGSGASQLQQSHRVNGQCRPNTMGISRNLPRSPARKPHRAPQQQGGVRCSLPTTYMYNKQPIECYEDTGATDSDSSWQLHMEMPGEERVSRRHRLFAGTESSEGSEAFGGLALRVQQERGWHFMRHQRSSSMGLQSAHPMSPMTPHLQQLGFSSAPDEQFSLQNGCTVGLCSETGSCKHFPQAPSCSRAVSIGSQQGLFETTSL
jgi:hypothetical protein